MFDKVMGSRRDAKASQVMELTEVRTPQKPDLQCAQWCLVWDISFSGACS
jgi:hypothetical protein